MGIIKKFFEFNKKQEEKDTWSEFFKEQEKKGNVYVDPNPIRLEDIYGEDIMMIQKDVWDKLPPNAQRVLRNNGFMTIQKEVWDKLPPNAQNVLRNNGFDVKE